jgi:hypothetical protein
MATKTTDRVALQRRLTTTDATASAPPQFPWLKTSSLRTICFIRTKFSNSCFLFFRNFYVILFHFVDVSYESLTTRCSLQHIIQLVDFLHYQHLARSKTLPFSTQSRAILRLLGALGKIIFSPLQTFFTRCDHVVIISTRIGMHASCMQTPELFEIY